MTKTDDRRFEFGKNWTSFLATVDEPAIAESVRSMKRMLGVDGLRSVRFLDVGCGSGLSSLAARRLGARVHSFDYDSYCVSCTQELRRRFDADGPDWTVEQGSALDREYLEQLGTFDVVYSWGVLHHTGQMWDALANMVPLVKDGGTLFISIYNDQGWRSRGWHRIKRWYVSLPSPLRFLVLIPAMVRLWGPAAVRDLARGRPGRTFREHTGRGMSPYHDLVDWVGGYPFEVAKPEEIFRLFRSHGFQLLEMTTVGGSSGCNQFVFRKAGFGAERKAEDAATESAISDRRLVGGHSSVAGMSSERPES